MRSLANRFRPTGPHARRKRLALVAGALALVVIPASLVGANDSFPDVPTSAFYHDSVNALVNANITAGCGSGKYCPNNAVTRGQMAVFLNKLGALSDNTVPVVDALSVNGHFIEGGFERDDLNDPNDTNIAFTGGGQTACETVTAGENSFGSYTISYQLINTPVGGPSSEKINVQVKDNPATPEDQVFELCLGTIDGSNLLAGVNNYQLYFQFIVFIGQGIFGSGASASGASAAPSRYGK